mgnify:CR=1 FL=1
MKKGFLIVISGPSGVGKRTVLTPLLNDPELNLTYSISMTTREKREGEINGKDYFFLTKQQFEQEIKNDNLLEYATYVDNYYGTPKKYVNDLRNQGKNVLLEIEPQGALLIMDYIKKQNDHKFLSIFIAPQSIEILKSRLLGRATESKAKIEKRIKQAEWELSLKDKYDYYVVNGSDPKDATKKIKEIFVRSFNNARK